MKFYEIKLKSSPKVIFAYNVENVNYKNSFPHTPNMLEFSVCEEGAILQEYENSEQKTMFPGMFQSIVKDLKVNTSCPTGVLQRHTTVGIVADYEYTLTDTGCADLELLKEKVKNGIILSPDLWKLGENYDKVIELIMNISNEYTSVNPCSGINAISEWYRLAGELSDIVLKKVSGSRIDFPSGVSNYVNKAKKYIKENYRNKLSVEEIAEYVGVSAGYLHNIFKAVTEMSIIEYINQYKVNLVKQYAKRFEISLKEAAYQVGIDDPSYMSRLFKKVSGMSFREYCSKQSSE